MIKKVVRIVLADDHSIFREGMKYVFHQNNDYKIIAEATNGHELIKIVSEVEADVIFVDVKMPVRDGIEATKKIRQNNQKVGIIGLSTFDNIEYFNSMIEAGANGFLLKNVTPEELIEAIDTVIEGNFFCSKEFAMLATGNYACFRPNIKLSEREKEVLKLICDGLSTTEIAKKLFLSTYTIEGHRKSLLIKTEMKNTASLVSYAIKSNLIKK